LGKIAILGQPPSVLNINRAIQVNIQIMRAFSQLRQMLSTHEELKRKITSFFLKNEWKYHANAWYKHAV